MSVAPRSTNEQFALTSFLNGTNAAWLENLAQRAAAGGDVPDDLRTALGVLLSDADVSAAARVPANLVTPRLDDYASSCAAVLEEPAAKKAAPAAASNVKSIEQAAAHTLGALRLIRAYRVCGHLSARLDPLNLTERAPHPDLNYLSYGFTEADLDQLIFIGNELGDVPYMSLRQIIDRLSQVYCASLSIEHMHLSELQERVWLQQRVENPNTAPVLSAAERKNILSHLVRTEGFEKFLHVKYMGTKRFGLDGGESVIAALEEMIAVSAASGTREIVFGMPHRGRLNVLTGVLGKPYRALLNEFQGGSANPGDVQGSGDVKYHLGASTDRVINGHKLHMTLLANPSHLEAVNPVVLGKTRAKQAAYAHNRQNVMPILMHGDAAFAGQGVVAECFACVGLEGYSVGGTVHVVVNNQIGFTTAPHFSRTTPHPSDMAKSVPAPVFHVNGDDPDAVVRAARLAAQFRQTFGKDVVLDVVCYRRFGHNEGDEPSFTQPLMYEKIRNRRTVADLYAEQLVAEGVIDANHLEQKRAEFKALMDEEFAAAQTYTPNKADWLEGKWGKISASDTAAQKTGVDAKVLTQLGDALHTVPEGFNAHKTVRRVLDGRAKALSSSQGIDWALAESLAFASLLTEGHAVRLSGQDVGRGTFSQRHARLTDQTTEKRYEPLNTLPTAKAKFEVVDSFLSEYAVLGFEFGYSWEDPDNLVLWEAQFGDFANGAQIMIDQFIASAETKWLRMSGLVLLLPHGYEGQGPEHSSARLERFLQLCAEDNMQVLNCTAPANYFHALRRQIHSNTRKPLVVMTPKSLLRHRLCVSTLADLSPQAHFEPLLPDVAEVPALQSIVGTTLVADKDIKRVVVCSGKVALDLSEERAKRNLNNVYIARLEQFYPFPSAQVAALQQRFPNAELVWTQEEPRNMGGWLFVQQYLEEATGKRPRYVGRITAASTATGSPYKHKAEQEKLMDESLVVA